MERRDTKMQHFSVAISSQANKKSNSIRLVKNDKDIVVSSKRDNESNDEPAKETPTTLPDTPTPEDAKKAVDPTPPKKSSPIHTMLSFLTGDAEITDYKLQYIAKLAGYGNADLKGKRWSFAKDSADFRFYIYPETLEDAFLPVGDFAMQKTYGTLNTILSKMPKVEIRSFQQHSFLQTIVDCAGGGIDGIVNGVSSLFNKKGLEETDKRNIAATEESRNNTDEYGQTFFGKIIAKMTPAKFTGGSHTALLDLPFIFYYGLAGAVTRCYFALPLDSNSYENLWGSTSQGWVSSKEATLAGKVDVIKGISDLSIGRLLTTAFTRQFGMQFMPTFDISKVSTKDGEGTLSITFNLINDTYDHAMANISFLRVLFPLAMWSNIGPFAASGDLFDVKVKGAMRWLMCAGNFECKPVGAIRSVFGSSMKIPDAYAVHCEFKSLLPNNLNNYLIGYLSEFKMDKRDCCLKQLVENITNSNASK